jgi:hypothetical protein
VGTGANSGTIIGTLAARENIELIPELARMKEEAFMESEAFTDKIALAERRDVHDKKV